MTERTAPRAPLVELAGLTRRFPGVIANDAIDLALLPGEIHVLLGENGAGKSTLIAMLSGLLQPDAGEIRIAGRPRRLASPRQALDAGIGTVFQHSMLVPSLTVAENLALGGRWWQPTDREGLTRRLAERAANLGLAIDPDARAGDLSLGEQQQVEIVRVLLRGSRVLVLDEPTSMLTPQGIEQLGALLRRVSADGIAVLFVSHKLGEALDLGQRISVLRHGRKTAELPPDEMARTPRAQAIDRIVRLMFGEDAVPAADTPQPTTAAAGAAPRPVLEVHDLVVEHHETVAVRGASLSLCRGEILGIAGIDGNGQKQLAEALAGQLPATAGRIMLDGRPIGSTSIAERRRLGLRYVTDDRLGEGTVASLPVSLNLLLKEIGEPPWWQYGLARPEAIRGHAEALIAAFDVRTPGPDTPIGRLSGGNIQKALLARELSGPARVVVYAKPTYGLDVRHTRAMRRRIREAAAAGVAALVVSTDLDELLELCGRIQVMARGLLSESLDNDAEARGRVARLMAGGAP